MWQVVRLNILWKNGKFNSIYGMCVTNEIRNNVEFNDEWFETEVGLIEDLFDELLKEL